ncbi:MAG: Tetratricopeptide repeat protein [Acidobacteria bacterium]|nr:Tetratricopeptide repeat protein [Acidobacteriota bacterium]
MSTYLGNPSLSTAVKDRVVATFQQALALYRMGRTEEVIQGCGLILQMDPLFDPGRKLLEKARNPMSPIDVDTLVPTTSADDALRQAREAMTARDYSRVVQITTEVLTEDLMNDDARILGDQAREKMEAAPFVEQFLKKCQQHLNDGNLAAAKADLEKARALDSDHPAIVQMERMVSGRGAAPAAPSPAPPPAAPPSSFSFDGGTSFVVDNPAQTPSTRAAAQASDFGFTFEEEKPAAPAAGGFGGGGFSFDSPAQPAAPAGDSFSNFSFGGAAPPKSDAPFGGGFSFDSPAPAAGGFSFDAPSSAAGTARGGEFDFSSASIETSPDDQRKIDQYLADGDRSFQSGDYQQAIDLWSRIFLIDVTNEIASERIERAKAKRREIEQEAETIVTAAVQAYERKDLDAARQRFAEVLRIDPQNATANDYMERLTGGVQGGAAAVETPYIAPSADAEYDIFAEDSLSGSYETPLKPPDPGTVPAAKPSTKKSGATKSMPVRASTPRSLPMGLIGGLLVLVLVAGGGYYAYTKYMSKPAYDPAATQAIFTQAQSLVTRGKYDQAIAVLGDIKPEDPQHDRALNLIADLQHKKTQAAETIDGRPAAVVYQEGLANGKAAFEAHDFDTAKKQFESAMRVKPLTPDMKIAYDTASQQVAKLDAAKALFAEHKYTDAITNLQSLAQQDPQNKNIQRMLTDAHFNQGATFLQEAKLPEAIREFDDVLKADPTDELAKKSRELAVRYSGEDKDLLYRIYVKYLPLRQ